jgi:hypothetical protein
MVLKWKKLVNGNFVSFDEMDAKENGAAIAEWGIFTVTITEYGKKKYKDGAKDYRISLSIGLINSLKMTIAKGVFLADAIKTAEDMLFKEKYDLPAEPRRIEGYAFRVRHRKGGMLIEIPEESYDKAMEDLARHCAQLTAEGVNITSVSEVYESSSDYAPRVAVLSTKTYKDEVKRLMHAS